MSVSFLLLIHLLKSVLQALGFSHLSLRHLSLFIGYSFLLAIPIRAKCQQKRDQDPSYLWGGPTTHAKNRPSWSSSWECGLCVAAITRELQNPCNGPIDINSYYTLIRIEPTFINLICGICWVYVMYFVLTGLVHKIGQWIGLVLRVFW